MVPKYYEEVVDDKEMKQTQSLRKMPVIFVSGVNF